MVCGGETVRLMCVEGVCKGDVCKVRCVHRGSGCVVKGVWMSGVCGGDCAVDVCGGCV